MGNLCSKRKGSDSSISVKSEGSNRKGSSEHVENHSQTSKKQKEQGDTKSCAERSSGAEATPSTIAAETPEHSLQTKDSLRSRIVRETEPSSISGDSMSLSSPTMINAPHTPDLPFPTKLPLEIKKQPENMKNLLVGRIGKVKPVSTSRKITLYVCAADSQDFRLEKGQLHTEVYPKLREYCSTRGFEIHITDLHWKTDLETKQDHDFPELCLGELRRQQEVSHIIPVLFLSNSLGYTLLPKTIEQQDFETALSNVSSKTGKALLEKWYKLDTHAQPQCYRLSPISEHIPNIKSENSTEKSEAISEWQGIVDEILDTMLRVFANELRDTYLTTVIEQEIHNSIFMSRDVGKRSIWTNRSFTGKNPQSPDMLTPAEVETNRRLESLHNELKNQLVSDRILTFSVKWKEEGICSSDAEHQKYLLDVSKQLSSHLLAAVQEIMEEETTKGKWKSCYGVSGSLCSEIMQHTLFGQQGAKCCLSFDNVINDIKNFVGSDLSPSNHPLVIHGPRASGKTCFLSRIIQQASSWYSECVVVYRFVGLTPESRSLVQLLRTVVSQVALLLTGHNYWIPHNAKCYLKELYKMISTSTTVLIVIDGLDRLTTNDASALDLLADPLPSKIKLIVSCADDTPVFQVIKSRIQQPKAFIAMPSLSLLSAESLLTASILQYSHSIDSEVQKRLSARLNNSVLPIYIKILAWQGAIDNKGLINLSQVTSVESLINSLFDFLEKVLDKEKISAALGLLCASRNGLCDSELLDLLAHSPSFSSKITFIDWAPATIFLAQLFRLLSPFLEWRVSGDAFVVQWRDAILLDLAKERYVGNDGKKLRQTLLSYFKGDWKDAKNGRFIEWNSQSNFRRAADEIPFLECHLTGSIKTSYLCNLEWMLKKIQNLSVFNVLEDIYLEASAANDVDLTLFRECLELSASALSYDASQFYGQMYNRLLPYFSGPESSTWSSKCPFIKNVFESAKSCRTPSFVPLSSFLHSPKNYETLLAPSSSFRDLDNGEIFFDEVYRMKASNQFVVSLSTAKEEVKVCDVYSEATIRTLKGVHNPISLKVIDEHRCVILCGRELITYNIDNGTQMTKLKGVMNQKMPFYGLHDENHIVAISRNRMYVNLMNLDSGDCITTFKVGEDRFLNSLLVSENGKFLVCGDETQKPFPLLVWDLPSRKLLYDLRIPHHEFVTSLAAITKEGHFVCCVCREVDDPGPNFIVVYDLQSGTLFKKWKPGNSTEAIAISQQGGCVINALDDNRIIVWDLVTGASQWSLEKHIAPPDILKLDNRGSRCLSCDSQGRDRSVCLWDVTTGHLLAIYTPDSPFTACEIFNNGDGVILGLKGRSEIATLTFQDSGDDGRVTEKYGSEEHHGKITVLKS